VISHFAELCKAIDRKILIDFPSKDLARLGASADDVTELKRLFERFCDSPEDDMWIEPFSIFRLENSDDFPLYVNEQLNHALHTPIHIERSESKKTVKTLARGGSMPGRQKKRMKAFKRPRWEFPLQSVEEINDELLVEEYQDRFSLKNLEMAIRKEKEIPFQ
jgi:hypothetical protein